MNRLARESSPYLRQHADNPVDWFPWGDEAFAHAQSQNLPILLSIGYSSCHWCHVMAHESFEDEETAAIMNAHFVNIKVDREERPDVDAIYMDATQALSGHGGWPMTVFLTPAGEPFFAGTYFPKTQQGHSPSFTDVIESVANAWEHKQNDLNAQASEISQMVKNHAELAGIEVGESDAGATISSAVSEIMANADSEWGGFGRAPKFPQTHLLKFLLSQSASGHVESFISTTLDSMAAGGIYDQLGGGFARYSTDPFWMVPHFEKMLYDQAQAVDVYLDAWLKTKEHRHLQVVSETIEYLVRDLRSQDGAFYSSEDADSDGEEGSFYVWRIEEIEEICGANASQVTDWYGITKAGNFEARNILHRPIHGSIERPAAIEQCRVALLQERARRNRPGRDDKVILEWNAMAIAAIARAAFATKNDAWADIAITAADFLLLNLSDGNDWFRSWHADSNQKTLAFAQDISHLVNAFTRLYELTGKRSWLDQACSSADYLVANYFDEGANLFNTTSVKGETLLANAREVFDGATPSANSQATYSLLRLEALTASSYLGDIARRVLKTLGAAVATQPQAFGALLAAINLSQGIQEIVIPGENSELLGAIRGKYTPTSVVAHGETVDNELWEGRKDGFAYVCRNRVCKAPTRSAAELLTQIG